MNMDEFLSWCNEMIEKYNIAEEDVAELDEILNGIDEEILYGTEYKEDEDGEEPEE